MDRLWLFSERACLVLGTIIGAATLYFTAGVYYNWNQQQPVPSSSPVIAGNAAMIPGWWIMASGGIGALLLVTAWIMIIIRLWRQPTRYVNKYVGRKENCEPERIFVDTTPEYLIGLFKDKLQHQGEKLAEPYIGKWIRVDGGVHNVRRDSISLKFGFISTIFLRFDTTWMDSLHTLQQNQQISAIGQIGRIDEHHLYLAHCELIIPNIGG
jgi:hypothetical protein